MLLLKLESNLVAKFPAKIRPLNILSLESFFNAGLATPLQLLDHPVFEKAGIQVYLKREDLIHPQVSGNKWRKLKYNLVVAKALGFKHILTFGGAYSNHIYSTAAAGSIAGFKTTGIIRGEETLPLNATLSFAKEQGMQLLYMDRTSYREKGTAAVIDGLRKKLGSFYLIPEGGTNRLALKGVEELLDDITIPFDYIATPVGTGGTLAGLIPKLKQGQRALGFSALKGDAFLEKAISQLLGKEAKLLNWEILYEYHFGGYAKVKPVLIEFMKAFETQFNIPLDPVYTAKMLYGLFNLAEKGFFEKGKTIIALHTGGLQGRAGFAL